MILSSFINRRLVTSPFTGWPTLLITLDMRNIIYTSGSSLWTFYISFLQVPELRTWVSTKETSRDLTNPSPLLLEERNFISFLCLSKLFVHIFKILQHISFLSPVWSSCFRSNNLSFLEAVDFWVCISAATVQGQKVRPINFQRYGKRTPDINWIKFWIVLVWNYLF